MIANVNGTTSETIHGFFNKIKENINQLCSKENQCVSIDMGVGKVTFMPNHTFDFKSSNINVDTAGQLETSVFDTDYTDNGFKSPFRQSKSKRGPLYARHLASKARGSSLKAGKDQANDINCLSNFLKDQITAMNDS